MNSSATSPWRTESNRSSQTLASVLLGLAGLALTVGFWRVGHLDQIGNLAGFGMGVFLLVGSVWMLLMNGQQIITLDPRRQHIHIESTSRLGRKVRCIPFKDVTEAYVDELGDTDGGSIRYHVTVVLRSGQKVTLFMGFYDGALNRSTAEARCARVLEMVQQR
jgi:hypothetical protein